LSSNWWLFKILSPEFFLVSCFVLAAMSSPS
jgi:hypothetical protein